MAGELIAQCLVVFLENAGFLAGSVGMLVEKAKGVII